MLRIDFSENRLNFSKEPFQLQVEYDWEAEHNKS